MFLLVLLFYIVLTILFIKVVASNLEYKFSYLMGFVVVWTGINYCIYMDFMGLGFGVCKFSFFYLPFLYVLVVRFMACYRISFYYYFVPKTEGYITSFSMYLTKISNALIRPLITVYRPVVVLGIGHLVVNLLVYFGLGYPCSNVLYEFFTMIIQFWVCHEMLKLIIFPFEDNKYW